MSEPVQGPGTTAAVPSPADAVARPAAPSPADVAARPAAPSPADLVARPDAEPPSDGHTGDHAVDEALRRLDEVDALDLRDQVQAFEDVHRALQDRLADAEG